MTVIASAEPTLSEADDLDSVATDGPGIVDRLPVGAGSDSLTDQDWTTQLSAVRELFARSARKVGVRYFSYQIIRCPIMGQSGPVSPAVTTFPESWQIRYVDEGYAQSDPVLAECLLGPAPFSWARLSESPGLGQRQRQFLKEAEAAGLGRALTIPIHAQGEVAVLNLVPDDGYGVNQMHENSHLLYLMAHYLHQKARRPLMELALATSARRRSLLSPRETEALEWTALGKTTREISSGLGISEKGVEFHLEGAKRKLQASNRTHAVAKALVLRLLFSAP